MPTEEPKKEEQPPEQTSREERLEDIQETIEELQNKLSESEGGMGTVDFAYVITQQMRSLKAELRLTNYQIAQLRSHFEEESLADIFEDLQEEYEVLSEDERRFLMGQMVNLTQTED